MTPIIEAQNISKAFYDPHKVEIITNLSFSIYPKERIAILGKSGEGKTTLLQILGTIDEPTSGKILYFGNELSQRQKNKIRNSHFGFVFQAFHLINDMTVLENILLPASIGRKSTAKGSASYKRACMLLEMVHLEDRIHFSAKKLSGGEKQRLAICRALINDPEILFADEPTGSLDHKTALEVNDLLLSTVSDLNKAYILVTHNESLAKLMTSCYELENASLKKIHPRK